MAKKMPIRNKSKFVFTNWSRSDADEEDDLVVLLVFRLLFLWWKFALAFLLRPPWAFEQLQFIDMAEKIQCADEANVFDKCSEIECSINIAFGIVEVERHHTEREIEANDNEG